MNTAHVAETSVQDTVPDAPSNTRSIFELSPAEQRSMPKITIEGHIYDADSQVRMVIINGKVRKENQFVSDGLMLQKITPDGVILDYRGKVFHLGVFDH
jgi:general secretion pathway protein B